MLSNKTLSKPQLERLPYVRDDDLTKEFPGFSRSYLRREKRNLPPIDDSIEQDRKLESIKSSLTVTEHKYQRLLEINELLEDKNAALLDIKNNTAFFQIKPELKESTSEATAVLLLSDVHDEEKVDRESINGLNEYNLEIADRRLTNFVINAVRLLNIQKSAITIKQIILAFLGDFISGNIHDELIENNQLLPMEAIIRVQARLVAIIKYLLQNTDCQITIPCHSGNHGRITDKTHIATENGNSLEFLMYNSIAQIFENEPRTHFIIPESYHSYIKVYDKTLRFSHGHFIKYGGGIGGIYIPVNKAIAQWNKAKYADIDCFGHFHQFKDGGNFITNGSVIGFNKYAMSIKADYEEAKQTFFLMDKHRGKTIVAPIFLDKN